MAVLKTDKNAFAECVTEKMLTYALGRGMESSDRRTVKQITAQLPTNNYRFSNVVLEIVKSVPFQMRKGDISK